MTGAKRVRIAVVAGVALASAAGYAALRIPMAKEAARTFTAMCARMQMRPEDWTCRITEGDTFAAIGIGSTFMWLGLALALAVVAGSGRRVAWIVPILPAVVYPVGLAAILAWWDGSSRPSAMTPLLGQSTMWSFGGDPTYWNVHWEAAAALDLLLICLPALAVVVVLRPAPVEGKPPVWAFRTALWACAGAAAVVVWVATELQLLVGNAEDTVVPALVIGLVGVLAGHRRGWLPWLLVPLAILLSGGPTGWAQGSISRFTYLGRFGGVVPLAAVGLLGALVPRLAAWLERRRAARPSVEPAGDPVRRAVRPAAVGLALSVGMLGTAAIMRSADPSSVQISVSLPTYLGVREAVEAGRDYPIDTLCDDAPDEALVTCRAVQKMLRERDRAGAEA